MEMFKNLDFFRIFFFFFEVRLHLSSLLENDKTDF